MPWSSGYESERGNLTSLLGTLAQMKEGKKNRRAAIFSDLLGIAGDIGGGFLQNKWNKEAATTKFGQEKELKGLEFENQKEANRLAAEQRALQDTIEAARGKTADERAYAQGLTEDEIQHRYRMAEIAAGKDGDGGGDEEKPGYLIARQMVEDMIGAVLQFDKVHEFTGPDFDSIQAQAIADWETGKKAGDKQFDKLTKEDIIQATNFWRSIYKVTTPTTPKLTTETTQTPSAPALPRVSLSDHGKAIAGGFADIGKMLKETGTQVINPGLSEQSVLSALQQAKAMLSPKDYAKSGLGKYESEISATGNLAPTRLKQIMDMIRAVTGK